MDLDKIVSDISKHYKGENAYGIFGNEGKFITDVDFWIRTGCSSLDSVLSKGRGIPGGRITTIYGNEFGGKSTLCLSILLSAQKSGYIPILFEPERSFTTERLLNFGISKENLIFIFADCIEEFFDKMEEIVKGIKNSYNDAKIVVVWDGLASTLCKTQLDADYGDILVAPVARAMSEYLKRVNTFVSNNNVAMVITNQVRTKIGVMFGDPETQPGGKALQFYSSILIRISSGEKIKDSKGNIIKMKSKIRIKKNKVFTPFKECSLIIDLENGRIKNLESIVETLRDHVKGKVFKYNDKNYQGEKVILKLIKNDKKARKEALKIITKGRC